MVSAAGIYLHIPYCKSRCSYCDFATDVYRSAETVDRYVKAIRTEITGFSENDRKVDTIYFGGGTPSLLTPDQVAEIILEVKAKFDISPDAEVTMEMNPATVSNEKLVAYRKLGVNRASFGVQTFNNRDLKLLARGHDADDARNTFRLLREAGFENISFDLIAGLPGQSLDDWRRNLDEALSMQPEHLSLYLLEIHEGTPLAEQVRSGRRIPIDDELAAGMYEVMIDKLGPAGYHHYEVSNFSKLGYESRHNTKYWKLVPVFGFGVSAHSFNGTERYANVSDTAAYVMKIEDEGNAEVFRERIRTSSEAAFLGLRLTEGIDVEGFTHRFGADLIDKAEHLKANGLIEIVAGRFRLTRKGMLFSNEVFAEFV